MENYFEVQLFSGCNGTRELVCTSLFDSVSLIAEKFSAKSDFSVEDELHYILSELVYHFLNRCNDYPIPIDKHNFNYAFSIFTNSFIDDNSDSHICRFSPDGVCVVCGSTKHNFDCSSCDCWDSDREGCTMPSCDKSYACPADSKSDYPY